MPPHHRNTLFWKFPMEEAFHSTSFHRPSSSSSSSVGGVLIRWREFAWAHVPCQNVVTHYDYGRRWMENNSAKYSVRRVVGWPSSALRLLLVVQIFLVDQWDWGNATYSCNFLDFSIFRIEKVLNLYFSAIYITWNVISALDPDYWFVTTGTPSGR